MFTKIMNVLYRNKNLLFLTSVRKTARSLFLYLPKYRKQALKAMTIYKKDQFGRHWYIKSSKHNVYQNIAGNEWLIPGFYHRENGPAYIDHTGDQCWRYYGTPHRDFSNGKVGPASVRFKDKKVEKLLWYQNDKHHRENGPAIITYSDGRVLIKEWWSNDKLHRVGGPAYIAYDIQCNTTKVGRCEWYYHGQLHKIEFPTFVDRKSGPTIAHYYDNGNMKDEYWFHKDMLHRIEGPAVVRYDYNGIIIKQEWWIEGILQRIENN